MMFLEPTAIWLNHSKLVPPRERLISALFNKASFQPPILDDMLPDINRLIQSVAVRFCDNTSSQLSLDELVGQGRLKLAEILTKGALERQPTREHFFRYFKSALCNQARSLVQRYRFTEKRTGVKPPPRESRVYSNKEDECDHEGAVVPEHHKNVELSLNDEELNLQVPDAVYADEEEYHTCRQCGQTVPGARAHEYEALCKGIEVVVYRALLCPPAEACHLAEHDARRGKSFEKINVRIRHEHLAKSIELSLPEFEKTVLSIRRKITLYRAMSDEERMQASRRSAIVAQLKEIFGLQIPPNTDDILVRRILTIAARDQYQKVYQKTEQNEQIAELLEAVGAKVPRIQADKSLSCYGVLYQRNQRVCLSCDLRKSCSVEAANVGLGKVVLSPRLLGTRQTRVPVILPKMGNEEPVLTSVEQLDWVNYLDETYTKSRKRDGNYYCFSADEDPNRSPLFFVNTCPPFRLRFINPSEALRARLIQSKRSWYAPERAASADICELIDRHAEDQLKLVKQYASI